MASEKLVEFLKSGGDWERRATSVPEIFVLKLPSDGRRPAQLAVELNPVDSSGKPTKRRGLILRTSDELKAFKDLINSGKLEDLMIKIDEVNPKPASKKRRGEEEGVIEI